MCNKTWIKPCIAFSNAFPASVVDGCGSGSTCLYLQTIGTRWFFWNTSENSRRKDSIATGRMWVPLRGGLGGFQCHSWRKNNDEATVIYKHKLHLELAFSSLSIYGFKGCHHSFEINGISLFSSKLYLSVRICRVMLQQKPQRTCHHPLLPWAAKLHNLKIIHSFIPVAVSWETDGVPNRNLCLGTSTVYTHICKYVHKYLGAAKGVVKGCHFSNKTVWKVLLLELVKG